MQTLTERLTSTAEGMKLWQQERAIFETTERICELMQWHGVTKSEMAKRLGVSKGYITQLLDGTSNMTIRTISDVYLALGREFHPSDSPLVSHHEIPPAVIRLNDLWEDSWNGQLHFQRNAS